MNDLKEITKDQLRAPPRKFRVAMNRHEQKFTLKPGWFLVNDHDTASAALKEWQELHHARHPAHGRGRDYFVFDDQGREVGILGIRIPFEDCVAPVDKFRVVCVDQLSQADDPECKPTYWYQGDFDDRAEAMRIATQTDDDRFSFMAVFSDRGVPQRADT